MVKIKEAYVELRLKNPKYVRRQLGRMKQYLQELNSFRKRFNGDLDKLLELASKVEKFFEVDAKLADDEKIKEIS